MICPVPALLRTDTLVVAVKPLIPTKPPEDRAFAAVGATVNNVLARLEGAAVNTVAAAAEPVVEAVVATVARTSVTAPVPDVERMFARAVPAFEIAATEPDVAINDPAESPPEERTPADVGVAVKAVSEVDWARLSTAP